MSPTVLPGKPYPLGATPMALGTNFALFSEHATAVFVCLFNDAGEQTDCVELKEKTTFVWHGLVRGVQPGQRYGYRVDGPWDLNRGMCFNRSKLMVDPYARAITGEVDHRGPIRACVEGTGEEDPARCDADDAAYVPKSVVVDWHFDWEEDHPLETPISDSVIYEVHVRGFSLQNPQVPERLRGTFAGLAHEASIAYLKNLGVTAVELMPVHQFIDEANLIQRGLRDYWGYNTLGFFAPMARYSSSGDAGQQVNEFKEMVKRLHEAGLEVILDVVYNHTCEGDERGPMLFLKGVDNLTYYRTEPDNPRRYVDYTGTGNSLNVYHPQTLKLIMDSLRYWVTEMHVDGFRFDLASTLARELHDVNKLGAFFDTIHQDPILAHVKLIAEPWDLGEGGYQVGRFPVLWAEWNGKYRDTVRRFWKGDSGQLSDFAHRLTGSSDLYQNDGRKPSASINFVTAHDGFTLWDLVSYNQKHNEANGDQNRDGSDYNDSWNMGVEGPTDDPWILQLRRQQMRNFLATLMLSQGVPMLLGGDEFGRSQRGNNNAYCQDNELSWFNWERDEEGERLLQFTANLIKVRRSHPNLHRRKFFQDRVIRGSLEMDIAWYGANGQKIPEQGWSEPWNKSIGLLLNGKTLQVMDDDGRPVEDDSFLILVNAAVENVEYTLPEPPDGTPWRQVLNTERIEDPFCDGEAEKRVLVAGRSMRVYSDATEARARSPLGYKLTRTV